MKKQQFKVIIDAAKEKIWRTLWDDATYQEWTAVFAEGSRADTDWQKGSKVLFHDGKGSGMVSQIEENIPNEFMSIKHLGEIKGGIEDTESDKVKAWAGAYENYTLKTVDGKTELTIDIDITEDFLDYMNETWPKALDKLKEISEK